MYVEDELIEIEDVCCVGEVGGKVEGGEGMGWKEGC